MNIIDILKRFVRSNPEIYDIFGRYISELLSYKGLEMVRINEYINKRGESMGILAESIDELFDEKFEQGIEQGIEQGAVQDKQEVLVRLVDRKFGISEADRKFILSISDPDKLDAALDDIITAETLNDVLAKLI